MYQFKISGPWWKIKHPKKDYPWPCEGNTKRTITIFDDDILNKTAPNTYTKVTGLCCCNIKIPDEDTVEMNEEKNLIMTNFTEMCGG
jgi:hypothetical protein